MGCKSAAAERCHKPGHWNSLILLRILLMIPLCPCFLPFQCLAQEESNLPASQPSSPFKWEEPRQGLFIGRYALDNTGAVITPEILLLRIDPAFFSVEAATAGDQASAQTDIRTLTLRAGGIAGINANFFDPTGAPLGLVIIQSQMRQKMHLGGKLLTGVFFVDKGIPRIIHRSDFSAYHGPAAIQAGPRLVADGKALEVSSNDSPNRRSGVAVTKDGQVLFYATVLRFPGFTLKQVQEMLLEPSLQVADALNLDGGGSSQLFVSTLGGIKHQILVGGGDFIPVGLVVKEKTSTPPTAKSK